MNVSSPSSLRCFHQSRSPDAADHSTWLASASKNDGRYQCNNGPQSDSSLRLEEGGVLLIRFWAVWVRRGRTRSLGPIARPCSPCTAFLTVRLPSHNFTYSMSCWTGKKWKKSCSAKLNWEVTYIQQSIFTLRFIQIFDLLEYIQNIINSKHNKCHEIFHQLHLPLKKQTLAFN